MKKSVFWIAVLVVLTLALTFALSACGEKDKPQETTQEEPVEEPTKVTISVVYHNNYDEDETTTRTWSKTTRTPNRTRTGYDFAGWTFDQEGNEPYEADLVEEYAEEVKGSKNKLSFDLWAQWEIKTFKVDFVVDDKVISTQQVGYGQAASEPIAELERALDRLNGGTDSNTTWLFEGWNDTFDYIVSGKTVTANLRADVSLTVNFVGGDKPITYTGKRNEYIPDVAALSKEGYVFDGWFDQDGDKYEARSTVFEKDATFRPRWSIAPVAEPMYWGSTSLSYGDNLNLRVEQAEVIGEGITYEYAWLLGDDEVKEDTVKVENLQAGTYQFALRLTASANGFEPQSSVTPIEVTVDKAHLTATIGDLEIVYGDPIPDSAEWSITYDGFVYDDNESAVDLSDMLVHADGYQPGSPAQVYRLSAEGLSSANYEVTIMDGNLKVKPRPITVTNRESRGYTGAAIRSSLIVDRESNDKIFAGDTIELSYVTSGSDRKTYTSDEGTIKVVYVSAKNTDKSIVTSSYDITYDLNCEIIKGMISNVRLPSGDDLTHQYDGAPHTVAVTVNDCVTEYSVGSMDDFSTELPQLVDVGTYTINVRVTRGENYEPAPYQLTYVVSKAPLTVNATALDLIYGDQPTLGYVVEGDTFGTVVTAEYVTLTTPYQAGDDVGTYTASVKVDEDYYSNFAFSYVGDRFDVTPKAINVSLSGNINVTYGDAIPDGKVESLLSVEGMLDKDPAFIVVSCDYQVGDAAGTYRKSIVTTATPNANYTYTLPTANVIVGKREATLQVSGASRIYGETLDVSSWNYSVVEGVYGQDVFDLLYSTDYRVTLGVGVGVAHISASPADGDEVSENYNLTVLSAPVDVTRRAVTIDVPDDYRVTYGNAFNVAACTYAFTSGNVVNGDQLTVTYSTAYRVGSVVDTYQVIVTVQQDEVAQNYDVSTVDGLLTVGKRAITLALDRTKAYNNDVTYSRTFTSEGITDMYTGDSMSGVLETTSGQVGVYQSDDGELGDQFAWTTAYHIYNVSLEDVTDCYDLSYDLVIVISIQNIAHTANDVIAEYDATLHIGEVIPAESGVTVTYSLDGQEGTYTLTSLEGWVNVGTYTVYYQLTQEGKTPTEGEYVVTITKRAATVTLANKTATYGDEVPALTYTAERFLGEDEDNAAITLATTYAQRKGVGSYDITATFTALSNYEIAVKAATLTVSPKTLTVSLTSGIDVTYGDAIGREQLRALLVVEGLTAWDNNFVSVSTTYRVGNGAGTYSDAIATAGVNANYSFSLPKANVVVGKRTATVKATNVSAVYGVAPVYNFQATNLYGSDKVQNVTYGLESDWRNVGDHTITPATADTANYHYEFVTGTLTVTKAALTVSATVPSITYGDAMPALTYRYVGFVYDDNASVLGGSIAVDCDYTTSPAATTFAVTLSGLESDNYAISYTQGTLTVGKKALTLTVSAHDAITYGDNVPTDFACTAQGFAYDDTLSAVTVGYTTAYTKGANASSAGYNFNVDLSKSSAANYSLSVGAAKKLVVNKAVPTLPSTLPSFGGKTYTTDTLESYRFALGSAWRWVNSSVIPTCDVTTYYAYYNPNSINYVDYPSQVGLQVVLDKATGVISANEELTATFTGNAIPFVSAFGATSNNTDGAVLEYECITTGETGTNISGRDGGVYTVVITLPASTNYTGAEKTVTYSIKAVLSGSSYYTVEEISGKTGTFILIGDAFVSGNVTIAGTLTLPYDGSSSNNVTTDGGSEGYYIDIAKESTYLKRLLTVKSGTMTVSGTLNVGGVVSCEGQKFQGHTSGNYAQINVLEGASIKVTGTMDCYGYVKGDGALEVVSGGVLKMPFVVRDFQGGTCTVGMYLDEKGSGTLITGYKNAKGIAPFSIYEMPNVQVLQTIRSGATVIGHAVMWADSKYNKTDAPAIASSGAVLNLTSGYMTIKFSEGYSASAGAKDFANKYPTTVDIKMYGNVETGSLSMDIKTGIPIISEVTVSMDKVILGLPYQYSITVKSGTFTVSKKFKMLNGSTVRVESGGTLNVTGSAIIYGGGWTDSNKPVTNYPSGKGEAKLIVAGGTLNVTGTLAGKVYGEGSGGRVVTGSNASFSMSSKEGYGTRGSGIHSVTFYLNITYTESQSALTLMGGSVTAAKGRTYTYNGTSWN